ncbi:hypothetical protein ABZT27_34880 [Streptomyces sp. NPDC005389]|uniref:hypothetical protein n=1 Tax=Streptomyces sp. NPDC005389 TaxID=3157040 RepID=UPI0033AD62E9
MAGDVAHIRSITSNLITGAIAALLALAAHDKDTSRHGRDARRHARKPLITSGSVTPRTCEAAAPVNREEAQRRPASLTAPLRRGPIVSQSMARQSVQQLAELCSVLSRQRRDHAELDRLMALYDSGRFLRGSARRPSRMPSGSPSVTPWQRRPSCGPLCGGEGMPGRGGEGLTPPPGVPHRTARQAHGQSGGDHSSERRRPLW